MKTLPLLFSTAGIALAYGTCRMRRSPLVVLTIWLQHVVAGWLWLGEAWGAVLSVRCRYRECLDAAAREWRT
jgi:hypothetical protein